MGNPLDGKVISDMKSTWPLHGHSINPLERERIEKPFDVGVRSINSLVTIGKGQRIGIIAGSGVGKSVLLQMMSKYSVADVVVVGLIGERAREVKVMVDALTKTEESNKIIIVAIPADRSPLLRMRGANRCTAIAEYFREKGKNVLLIMDSLTRVAHAKREIGLAVGEQPTSKGYPPSVISLIPSLNSETINLADNIITLNSNFTGSTATENAGIEVERGDETNVALQELDIINSPVRRVSTQTIPSYYRMRIIDSYGLVRSVYQDDAIPDNVWTIIAGEFCSITSSGRCYCRKSEKVHLQFVSGKCITSNACYGH